MTDLDARALLDEAPCALLRTAEDGLIERANRSFCAWTGHEEAELVGCMKLQDFFSIGGRIFHQTHWTPLLRMQGSVSEIKLELRSRGGEMVPVVLNAIRRQAADGRFVHDIAAYIARDRDRYERELLQSRKDLEAMVLEANRLHQAAADRALFAEQMIGIVGHDLRNPLSTIQLSAAVLGRGDLTPAQRQVVERVDRATGRAGRLIGELMDFTQARIGSGLPVTPRPIDPHETSAAAVDELSQAYPGRLLRHQTAGAGRCIADADRLSQLIGNLVSNAMTYGAPDSLVTVTSTVEPGNFHFAVHNRGPVIPLELQSRIFAPMTRGDVDGSASRSVGLGLFIVSEIAKAHGGRVEVDSAIDRGTTFVATMPR